MTRADRPAASRSLFLVRHAIAAERGDEWPDDTVRPLTHKGVARMQECVSGLRALGVEIDVVLTSPLLRARQTADVLVAALKPTPDLAVVTALAPGNEPASVIDALAPHHRAHSLALVGHEPALGTLAAWLVGAREPWVFKKGGVCRIDFAEAPRPGRGHLVWLATPAMLRAVGND